MFFILENERLIAHLQYYEIICIVFQFLIVSNFILYLADMTFDFNFSENRVFLHLFFFCFLFPSEEYLCSKFAKLQKFILILIEVVDVNYKTSENGISSYINVKFFCLSCSPILDQPVVKRDLLTSFDTPISKHAPMKFNETDDLMVFASPGRK